MAAAANAGLRRSVRKEKRKSDNTFLISMNSRGCWPGREGADIHGTRKTENSFPKTIAAGNLGATGLPER
jgi:hypothetical protein